MKLKHLLYLMIPFLLQACVSSKGTREITADSNSEIKSDSTAVNISVTPEEAGIKVNKSNKTKSIVTPEKKKK